MRGYVKRKGYDLVLDVNLPQFPQLITAYKPESYTAWHAAGVLKYNDTSATAGTTYFYKIRAVSGTDYSPYTAEVSGKR